MKIRIIIMSLFILAACTSPPKKQEQAPPKVEMVSVTLEQGKTQAKDLTEFAHDMHKLQILGVQSQLSPEKWQFQFNKKGLIHLSVSYLGRDNLPYIYTFGRSGQFKTLYIYFDYRTNTIDSLYIN